MQYSPPADADEQPAEYPADRNHQQAEDIEQDDHDVPGEDRIGHDHSTPSRLTPRSLTAMREIAPVLLARAVRPGLERGRRRGLRPVRLLAALRPCALPALP